MKIKINEEQLKLLVEHIICEKRGNKKERKTKWFHNEKGDGKDRFWGKVGAGALILCSETKRFLLPLRSRSVDEGGTWGTWGGAIDSQETPIDAVEREFKEETKYKGNVTFHPLHKFEHESGFVYYNFVGVVDQEFKPLINWETERAEWRELYNFPKNLHFGMKDILSNGNAMRIINDLIGES